MSIYLGSLVGLLIIACAHLFVRRAFASDRTRGFLLDGLTGVAIAYAFVDAFPHLASMQAKLENTVSSGLLGYLGVKDSTPG